MKHHKAIHFESPKSLKQGKTNHCRKEWEPGKSWEEDEIKSREMSKS